MSDSAFVIERRFDAPRALVWRTFTEKDLLARWYGPGVETVIHELDVRPGGVWKNEMRMGGRSSFERMDYTEVEDGVRLVWEHVNADATWAAIPNPMVPGWPKALLAEVDFADDAGGTRVRLRWSPRDATADEIAVFQAAMAGFGRGWGSGFDIIEEILAELQA
ncbi:MAG: SRPBCC domain-containing protein [Maritimibacter sp.]|nr:SRPBCC domain-containing protein [Maritimibacter sp.]